MKRIVILIFFVLFTVIGIIIRYSQQENNEKKDYLKKNLPISISNPIIKSEKSLLKKESKKKQSVQGDQEENGIRREINIWINQQSINHEQKFALIQLAKIIQKKLVESERINKLDQIESRTEANKLATDMMNALQCLWKKFSSDDASMYFEILNDKTVNTSERKNAEKNFDLALNGSVISLPDGDTCAY